MTGTKIRPDSFDRTAKLLVDARQADSFEEAAALLRTYRFQIVADRAACASEAWQAAMLTAVNAGVRAMHGGVAVVLAEDGPCRCAPYAGESLAGALRSHGAAVEERVDGALPTLVFAAEQIPAAAPPGSLHLHAGQWTAGVSPDASPGGAHPSVLAAVTAAAIAVSECFQRLRGYPVAADRTAGVSLWSPESHWRDPDAEGPAIAELPAAAWLLGLGHLGQAYAWLLGLLPYPEGAERRVVLQDDDRLSAANRSTSMLERGGCVGVRKARLVSAALEAAGWETAIVERRYHGGLLRWQGDPPLLLAGVDNAEARRQLDETGFAAIWDGGLGAGPDGYLGMSIRRLPGHRPAREIWRAEDGGALASPDRELIPAYRRLEEATGDRCGVEQLAGRTVATAFVGVTAAAWVLGGVLRELHGGAGHELVDYSLRDPGRAHAVEAQAAPRARLTSILARPHS